MNTSTELEIMPEEKQLKEQAPIIIQKAQEFKVIDDFTCQQAVDEGNKIKSKLDLATAFFKPMKDAANLAHKAICNREKEVVDSLESAKKIYIKKGADYQLKKQEEFEAKERAAKEAAEKREREERARLAQEAAIKEAEENKKREEARKAKEKADKLAAEGREKEAAVARAKAEKAEEEANAAASAVETINEKKDNVYYAPRPVQQAQKAGGMSVQAVFIPEITDEKKVPIKWRGPVDLGRLKSAKKSDPTLEVPGVRFIKQAQGAALGGVK